MWWYGKEREVMKPLETKHKVTNNLKKKDWHIIDTSVAKTAPASKSSGGGQFERVAIFNYVEPPLPPVTNPPSAIRDYSLE